MERISSKFGVGILGKTNLQGIGHVVPQKWTMSLFLLLRIAPRISGTPPPRASTLLQQDQRDSQGTASLARRSCLYLATAQLSIEVSKISTRTIVKEAAHQDALVDRL